MVLTFAWLPPEVNSARIVAGAGTGSLFSAAWAWDGLQADLAASASSFQSVISSLANGTWTGAASLAMAAAAAPYVAWLQGAAAQAAAAASQARVAASAFESALAATVPLPMVTSNRAAFKSLAATNYLGLNTPQIFQREFEYAEMWAVDVGAMLGYHSSATSAITSLAPFALPALSLSGLQSAVSTGESAVSSAVAGVSTVAAVVPSALVGGVSTASSLASSLPLSSIQSFAQIGMYPVSMMMSPMMSLLQMANSSSAAANGAGAAAALADAPKMVGGMTPDLKPLGGIGGGGMGGGLGQAHLVGAMSVPPTWQGSMPTKMASSAMSGLGAAGMPNAAMAGAPAGGGGMPMMPMPMGMGGAGGGMPGGPLGRGGASPHVTQNRPSVVPRIGVG